MTYGFRGVTALLVAVATRFRLAVVQAKYCSAFQLTHMLRGNHAQPIASNGGQGEMVWQFCVCYCLECSIHFSRSLQGGQVSCI